MNRFVSPNKADNVTIADAMRSLGKWTALGFRFSPLHFDETESGATETSYVPVNDIPSGEIDGKTKYNCIVFAGGDWHNVAHMMRLWGRGTAQDFRELYDDIHRGRGDASDGLLNIPGAYAAIEKLIVKA